jgi:hypothetical protein
MILNNRRFLKWFVRFGKTKSQIYFFLFLIGCTGIFLISYCLIYKIFSDKSFSYIFNDSKSFLIFLVVIIILKPWSFYEDALKKINEYETLEKRGLTEGDIERIEFVKEWAEVRKVGKYQYCLFNKGIITGLIIFMPIPCLTILSSSILNSFSEFYNSIAPIFVILVFGYLSGVLIYSLRWILKERNFINLTDPIR